MPEVEMHYLTFGENQTQTPHVKHSDGGVMSGLILQLQDQGNM